MNRFTITKNRFLEFYYESGQDSEIESLKNDLANLIISKLEHKGSATITVEELFNNCNHDSIKLEFLEEYKDIEDIEGELSDFTESHQQYEVILIDDVEAQKPE